MQCLQEEVLTDVSIILTRSPEEEVLNAPFVYEKALKGVIAVRVCEEGLQAGADELNLSCASIGVLSSRFE